MTQETFNLLDHFSSEELQTEFGQYFDYEAYSRTLLTSGYRHQGDFYFCVA